MIFRKAIISLVLCVAFVTHAIAGYAIFQSVALTSGPTNVWAQVPIGGGGFATGGDVAADGTTVARIDVYGAYIQNATTKKWSLITTRQSLPSPYNGLGQGGGVVEIRISPANTNVLYMILGSYGNNNAGYLVSTNQGANWTSLGCTGAAFNANDGTVRTYSPFIGLDPANQDIAWMATASGGVYKITGGTTGSPTCTLNGTVPGATSPDGNLIAYDPTSTVTGGITQGLAVSSYSHGVYLSTNAGAALTVASGTGAPTTMINMKYDPSGNLWVIDGSGAMHELPHGSTATSAWTTVSGAGTNLVAIAFNGASYYDINTSGAVGISTNSGGAWSAPNTYSSTRVCPDIPWQCTTNGVFMAAADIVWDSANSRLDFFEGLGFWYTASPTTTTVWTEQSVGIENMVSNEIISPPGENPMLYVWDQQVFPISSLTSYPTLKGANYNRPTTSGTSAGSGTLNFTGLDTTRFDTNYHMSAYDVTHPAAIPNNALVTGVTSTTVSLNVNVASPGVSSGDTIIFAQAIVAGWSGDYAAGSPATNIGIFNLSGGGAVAGDDVSGITTTNGANGAWAPWTYPTPYGSYGSVYGGSIAMCDTSHAIYAGANNSTPIYSSNINLGPSATWTAVTTIATTGYTNNYYIAQQVVAADRVTAQTALLYNFSNGKIYKTTDCGATWSNPSTPNFTSAGFFQTLQSVPGQGGNYFYTPGQTGSSHPNTNPFYRTTDGGTTWTSVSNVEDVWAFGTGKVAAGQTYPAIYIAGFVNQGSGYTWGIWRSVDNAVTWTNLGDGFPGGSTSPIVTISGDNNTYGLVYVCTVGNSCWYDQSSFLEPANDNAEAFSEKAA